MALRNQHWDHRGCFEDPFLAKIADSAIVGRLRDIGFLGAIDYVQFSKRTRRNRHYYNRYEHSIGVANLALLYADIQGLPQREARVLAAAGLLHDVGHGPLSHTLEPIFRSYFGFSHHSCGKDILFGRTLFGYEIIDIMEEFGVDIEEVVAMIEGDHKGSHAFLFSCPINVDTLDGICRTKKFAATNESDGLIDPRNFVISLAESEGSSTNETDEFWQIKDEVYNQIVHSSIGLLFDGLAQAYMQSRIDEFSAEDCFTTERDLELSHPMLFELLNSANASFSSAYDNLKNLVPELLGYTVKVCKRGFQIVDDFHASNSSELELRYTQTTSYLQKTIEELVHNEIS